EEEEVLASTVVRSAAHLVHRDRVERRAQRAGVLTTDDAALCQHHEVGIVDGEERHEEECLGVLEVLGENVRHVLRIEPHWPQYSSHASAALADHPPSPGYGGQVVRGAWKGRG